MYVDLVINVSIPFTPGNSFLLAKRGCKRLWEKECQSPSHRGTHFYALTLGLVANLIWDVSIPFTPGNSFLPGFIKGVWTLALVSIPFTPGNSFLLQFAIPMERISSVSIPFTPGNSFLQGWRYDEKTQSWVSIPFTPGNSFLRYANVDVDMIEKGVNPLHTGELISTEKMAQKFVAAEMCVNPLHTGELISTLTLIFC